MNQVAAKQAKEIAVMKLALTGVNASQDIVFVINTVMETMVNLYHIDKEKFAMYGVSPETTRAISQIQAGTDGRTAFLYYVSVLGVNRSPSELMNAAIAYINGYKVDRKTQYDTVNVLAYIYFDKPVEIERFLVIDNGALRTIGYNEEIAKVASLAILSGKNMPTITAGFDTDKDAPCNGESFDVFVTKAGEKVIIDQNGDSIVVTDEELVDITTVGIDGTAETIVSAIEQRDFSSLKVTTLFEVRFIKG